MSRKIYCVLCIILFALAIIITYTSYAYFRTEMTGTATLTAANWAFTVNDATTPFTVNLGDLYPGVDNSFQLKLSAVGSEVPVEYTIKFTDAVDAPNNLHFYRDSGKNLEVSLNDGTFTGNLSAGAETYVTIYYYWPYGNSAEPYVPGQFSFTIEINGHQKNPNEGA